MVSKKSKIQNLKYKIKRGDTVRILSGKDKGKAGPVMLVLSQRGKVLVEGINMVKKHIKPKRAGEKGQRVSIASPIDVSNAQLICPSCKKSTRVKIKYENDKKIRLCKKCGGII